VVAFVGDQSSETGHCIAIGWADEVSSEIDWDTEVITPDFTTCRDVFPGYIDAGTSLDFAASSLFGDTIAWFSNSSGFSASYTGIGTCKVAKGIAVLDFDGDTDNDVVAASYSEDITTGRRVNLYLNPQESPPAARTSTLTLTASSSVSLNGNLSYSYEFTLDEESSRTLYAWYKIITPDLRVIAQSPVDTLGTAEDTYTGEGTIEIADDVFAEGDECTLFLSVGHLVYGEGEETPGLLHGDHTQKAYFTVSVDAQTDVENSGFQTLPLAYEIVDIYPNPFNPSTSITLTLPQASDLTVTVYNVIGQQVAELANSHFSAGNHSLTFDASELASGLYFVRASVTGKLDQVQKVMMVR